MTTTKRRLTAAQRRELERARIRQRRLLALKLEDGERAALESGFRLIERKLKQGVAL